MTSVNLAHETLLTLFEQHRRRTDTFCHFWRGDSEQAISFTDLFASASRFTSLYRNAGLDAGATVIIATDFSPESMYAFAGALIGGFVPAFLAPFTERQHFDQFAKTIAGVVEYTRPGGLVVSPGFDRDLVTTVPIISTDQAQDTAAEPERLWARADPDDVAFIQFSSGTTGLRKGVMLRHATVVAQLHAFLRTVPLTAGDVIASWLPLYHDMGLIACFIIPLALGVPLALQDPIEWAREPARLFAAIERHRATHVWLPNFAFNHLRLAVPETSSYDLSSVKAFINCSEPCKSATFDGFADRFARFGVRQEVLATSYAMAEAVFAVTQSPVGERAARLRVDRDAFQAEHRLVPARAGDGSVELLSTGRLLPGLRLVALDDNGEELAEGHIGELALAGEFIFGGYHNNPEASAAAFDDGWYRTGDLGAVLNGEVFVTGRKKDIIIVNGRNFYAHDIEACASRVVGVKPGRVVAFAIENRLTGSEEAVLVAETDALPDEYRALAATIKRTITEGLGLTAIRAQPVPLRWLVKTTSGKVSRSENSAKYIAERQTGSRRALGTASA